MRDQMILCVVTVLVVDDELRFTPAKAKVKTQAIAIRSKLNRKHMIMQSGKPQHLSRIARRNAFIER